MTFSGIFATIKRCILSDERTWKHFLFVVFIHMNAPTAQKATVKENSDEKSKAKF